MVSFVTIYLDTMQFNKKDLKEFFKRNTIWTVTVTVLWVLVIMVNFWICLYIYVNLFRLLMCCQARRRHTANNSGSCKNPSWLRCPCRIGQHGPLQQKKCSGGWKSPLFQPKNSNFVIYRYIFIHLQVQGVSKKLFLQSLYIVLVLVELFLAVLVSFDNKFLVNVMLLLGIWYCFWNHNLPPHLLTL